MYRMFEKADKLAEDRLNDAVLHAMLLVTPIGLNVQAVLSGYGLELMHVMNCGCMLRPRAGKPFEAPLGRLTGYAAIVLSVGLIVLYLPGSPSALQWPWEWSIILFWVLLGALLYTLEKRVQSGAS